MKKFGKNPIAIGCAVLAVCALAYGGTNNDTSSTPPETPSSSSSIVSQIDTEPVPEEIVARPDKSEPSAAVSSAATTSVAELEPELETAPAASSTPAEEPAAEETEPAAVAAEDPEPVIADTPEDDGDSEIIVYVTNTGKKYHRASCSSLKKSKIEITLENAKRNYEPCEKCNPPT